MGASVLVPAQGIASPHVIAQLGTAPLVPQITSIAQLQDDLASKKLLFSAAAAKLGLTPSEYAQFATHVQTRRVAYVTIPRRLDGMSWAGAGGVSVLYDVIIPADTRGWEVDLVEHGQILAIYVPARCGNLSLLHKPLPRIARAKRHTPVHVAARVVRPRAGVPAAPPVAAVTAPATTVAVATPSPTPAPFAVLAATTGPSHHLGWLPYLIIPFVAALVTGHGNQGVPEVPVPISGGGLPPPVIAIPRSGPGGFRIPLPTPPPGCVNPTPTPH